MEQENRGLQRSQSAGNRRLHKSISARGTISPKLLVIFTVQPPWCRLFMCFALSWEHYLLCYQFLGESFLLNWNHYSFRSHIFTASHTALTGAASSGQELWLHFIANHISELPWAISIMLFQTSRLKTTIPINASSLK